MKLRHHDLLLLFFVKMYIVRFRRGGGLLCINHIGALGLPIIHRDKRLCLSTLTQATAVDWILLSYYNRPIHIPPQRGNGMTSF